MKAGFKVKKKLNENTNKNKISFKKKIMIIGSIVVVVATGIGIVTMSVKAKEKDAASNTYLETTPLEKQDLKKMISVTGTIASSNLKNISSEVTDTKVTEVKVAVGDTVKKGDVLAVLDSSNLEVKLSTAETTLEVVKQKASLEVEGAVRNVENTQVTRNVELERSNKAVAQAYQDYAEAVAKKETTYQEYQNSIKQRKEKEIAYYSAKGTSENTVKEVEIRRKAQETAQNAYDIALDAYESAVKENAGTTDADILATIDSLKTAKDNALVTLNAAKASYSSIGAISTSADSDRTTKEAEYSLAKTEETTKEAEYKAAVDNIETTTKAYDKAVEAAQDTERSTQKAIEDQKDSLQSAELTTKNTATSQEELEVKKIKEQIAACTITAPIDGIVTSLSVQPGDLYKSGDMMTIQDTSNFMVSATVDQYDISDVFENLKAVVKTETTGDTEMEGVVTFVSPVPKSTTSAGSGSGTNNTTGNDYEIKVALKEGSDRLRIGMTAKTSIIIKEQKDAFVVPYYCIQEDTDGSFYITVMENGVVDASKGKKIVVVKGLETDYYTAIESSELKEGMNILAPSVTNETSLDGSSSNTGTTVMY